jgi:site-specific recombinase XerD
VAQGLLASRAETAELAARAAPALRHAANDSSRAADALDVYLRDARPELVRDPAVGHQSFTSTQIYTDIAAADLTRMLARAHPRERAWRRKARARGRTR